MSDENKMTKKQLIDALNKMREMNTNLAVKADKRATILAQYIALEAELGFPLSELSSLSKIYMKSKEGDIFEITEFGFDFHNKRIVGLAHFMWHSFPVCAYFKDRGKSWGISERELL